MNGFFQIFKFLLIACHHVDYVTLGVLPNYVIFSTATIFFIDKLREGVSTIPAANYSMPWHFSFVKKIQFYLRSLGCR